MQNYVLEFVPDFAVKKVAVSDVTELSALIESNSSGITWNDDDSLSVPGSWLKRTLK